MLTKLTIRNYKCFEQAEIELGSPVLFIGPNNSGKTSAMQALALWDLGLKRLDKKHSEVVGRHGFTAVPVPSADLLWRKRRVQDARKVDGRQRTSNVPIEIVVEGVTGGRGWTCGLEFDYANDVSFHCRPLRLPKGGGRMPVPEEAEAAQVVFLHPMSGLAATETRLDDATIRMRIVDGRTAEVLRNLCYRVWEGRPERWEELVEQIRSLFGAELDPPRSIAERGEIEMAYREHGVTLDLSSSGRGLQQTLLILAYLYANPGATLLLDEPDAHLEILRQRQIYRIINDVASESGSQIIAASHSEVLLNEAAGRDMVIAFVGSRPHRIGGRGSQVRKALQDIPFDQYYQAEQTGWVLYLEGPTDLAILRVLARRLDHEEAAHALERPFVHYVANRPPAAQHHFHGLKEAVPALQGVVLFDRLEGGKPSVAPIECLMWERREIENYLCSRSTLEAYAAATAGDEAAGPLFAPAEAEDRLRAMREAMEEVQAAMETLGMGSPWDTSAKVSDDFLSPLFDAYFRKLGLPNLMAKKNFYGLAEHVPLDEIDPEIREKLDGIAQVAGSAR